MRHALVCVLFCLPALAQVQPPPGGGGSGGTSSNFGAAFPGVGTAAGFKDSNGNMAAGLLDMSGNLLVTLAGSSGGIVQTNMVQWNSVALGSPSNYGTSPGAVPVIGVNANVTNSPTVNQGGAPWSVSQSGSPWGVSGTVTANQGGAPWTVNNTPQAGVPDVTSSGTLGMLLDSVSISVAGLNSVSLRFTASTLLASMDIESTSDGVRWEVTNWRHQGAVNPTTYGAHGFIINPTTSDVYDVLVPGGASQIRIRVQAYTSGSGTLTMRATTQPDAIPPYTTSNHEASPSYAVAIAGDNGGNSQIYKSNSAGQNLVDVQTWADTALGAPSAYGTSPGAVTVPGVNAFITNTPTVTANAGTNLNTSALALDTSVNGVLVTQGAATSGLKGPLVQCATTTSAPTYGNNTTNPCSSNTSGGIRVDGSAVTQPISGSISQGSAAASTAGWPVTGGNIAEATASWTSATAQNTVLRLTVTGYNSVIVFLNQGTTITGGVVTFEISDTAGFSAAYPIECTQLNGFVNGTTYTLVASTNQALQCNVASAVSFQVRLSTAISGTATVAVGITAGAMPIAPSTGGTVSGTGTFNINHTQTAGTTLGALSTYGTSPGSVTVDSVNAFITNLVSAAGNLGDNGALATTNRVAILPSIAQTDFHAGAAISQGKDAALTVGTDGLLWTAQLPAMRPASYIASAEIAGSSTTDVSCIPGNGTNTVLVTGLTFIATQGTAAQHRVEVIKRSAADSGGTSANMTRVAMDSNYSVASTTPVTYTGTGPAVGAAVGDVFNQQQTFLAAASTTAAAPPLVIDWSKKPIVLRGTTQEVCINLGGALTTGVLDITWNWIETATITP